MGQPPCAIPKLLPDNHFCIVYSNNGVGSIDNTTYVFSLNCFLASFKLDFQFLSYVWKQTKDIQGLGTKNVFLLLARPSYIDECRGTAQRVGVKNLWHKRKYSHLNDWAHTEMLKCSDLHRPKQPKTTVPSSMLTTIGLQTMGKLDGGKET